MPPVIEESEERDTFKSIEKEKENSDVIMIDQGEIENDTTIKIDFNFMGNEDHYEESPMIGDDEEEMEDEATVSN